MTRPSLRQRRSGSSQIHTADLFAPVYSFCPGRGASFATCLTFPSPTLEWSVHGHGANAPLTVGGAISGSYRRPRCSRRPPPFVCGVARVLCQGQPGHHSENSDDKFVGRESTTANSSPQDEGWAGCWVWGARGRGKLQNEPKGGPVCGLLHPGGTKKPVWSESNCTNVLSAIDCTLVRWI